MNENQALGLSFLPAQGAASQSVFCLLKILSSEMLRAE
jgi:hypothetical protein